MGVPPEVAGPAQGKEPQPELPLQMMMRKPPEVPTWVEAGSEEGDPSGKRRADTGGIATRSKSSRTPFVMEVVVAVVAAAVVAGRVCRRRWSCC